MVSALFDPVFQKQFSKIKDALFKERIIKQINRIRYNPGIGKPMGYGRKGTRELRIPPFRLSYRYRADEDLVEILGVYHKDEQ